MSNVNDSGVIRRQIEHDMCTGKFDVQYLVHISRYEKAAELIITQSKQLGYPVNVASIGCGDMWELRVLWNLFWVKKNTVLHNYTGIDIQDTELPVGQRTEGVNLEFVEQDITEYALPFDNRSLDLIFALESLEHIDRKFAIAVLDEMANALKPGGILYLSTPNGDVNKFEEKWHRYEWPLNELTEELKERFSAVDVTGTFISDRNFRKANAVACYYPEHLVNSIKQRFGSTWAKVILAAPYPEYSENLSYMCVK